MPIIFWHYEIAVTIKTIVPGAFAGLSSSADIVTAVGVKPLPDNTEY